MQVIATLLLMGFIFIPVGLVALRASNSVYIISTLLILFTESFSFLPSKSPCFLQYLFDLWICRFLKLWIGITLTVYLKNLEVIRSHILKMTKSQKTVHDS